ncbi:hypothetical protein EPB69_14160 [Geobacillus stearothermophilus]|nr:hypothetical protein EPB69_14160 [Geobacillus stearothermophilus]
MKGLAAKLVQLPEIESVEPNYVIERTYTPSDPGYSKQWHLKKINAPKAWDTTKGSGQITVAVVDDGVQMNHPDLAGKIVSPYNVLTGAKSVPAGEHGTHVAGIIAASINKKGVVGVAPNVKIMPVNVFEGDGATSYDVAYGIVYAVDHGANVINLSLGSYSATVYEAEAVQYAVSKGVVLVAAAGNDDTYFPVYPAAFDPVIAVSATDSSDWITDFSNYGDYIDLAAPGVNIYSTFPGSSYYGLHGTSMAAPIVSGTAALVLSKNPLLTRGEVENILRKSTVDLGGKGWDVFYGYGRVDAYKAVRNTPSPLSSISAAGTFTMKGNNKVGFSLSAYRKGLKVTAYVKNSRGYAVRTIAKNKLWNSNRISLSWDGKQDNGAFVGSGAYTMVVQVSNGRETVAKTKQIKTEHPLNAGDQVLTWDGLNDNGETVFYDDSVYTFRIAARFANGVIETAEGKIDNSADPPWLVSSLYSFTYDSYGNRTALNLSIRVTEAVTATLFVYDPYGDAYIDEKTYSLKANVETNIVYAKKDKYSDYYYLLAYKDRLGNVYFYGVDETEETGYAASYRLQKENGAKNGLKRSVN